MLFAKLLNVLAVIVAFTLAVVSQPEESQLPRVILDWSQCGIKVVKTETVEKLSVAGGGEIRPERQDCQLLLINLRGKSPKDGYFSLAPQSFGVQFIWRGMNKLLFARAWGVRGTNVDTGKPVESWNSRLDEKVNLGIKAGDDVNIWIACDVPKEVREVFVVIPSLIEEPVKLPK